MRSLSGGKRSFSTVCFMPRCGRSQSCPADALTSLTSNMVNLNNKNLMWASHQPGFNLTKLLMINKPSPFPQSLWISSWSCRSSSTFISLSSSLHWPLGDPLYMSLFTVCVVPSLTLASLFPSWGLECPIKNFHWIIPIHYWRDTFIYLFLEIELSFSWCTFKKLL